MCSVCGEPVGKSGAKGFCFKHYWKWKTYGDPLATKRPPLAERHAAGTDRRGPDECWEWTKGTDKDGYGMLPFQMETLRAHRVAYELATGKSADGLVICHSCDNPPCQNPKHLFPGTVADNNRDKAQKGRAPGNSRGTLADLRRRLTAEQVEAIRQADVSAHGAKAELARQYGISHEHVRRILNGTRR